MGWGSAFSSAFSAASNAVQSAASAAAETAQTAWDYTKQKSEEAYNAARDWIAPRADAAQEWASDTASAAKQTATDAAEWTRDNYVAARDYTAEKANETAKAVGEAFEGIEDAFTPQPAGSPGEKCPYQTDGKDAPPPPRGDGTCKELPPCLTGPVIVSCAHGSRGFKLQPPNTPTNASHDQIIQVIADRNEFEDITVQFSCGNCPHGAGPDKPHVFLRDKTSKSTMKASLRGPPSPLMPHQSPGKDGPTIPFYEFVRHFVGSREYDDYKSYYGGVSCCEGKGEQSFEVQVFPVRKWSGEFTAGTKIKYGGTAAAGDEDSTVSLEATGNIKCTYGMRSIEVDFPTWGATNKFLGTVGPDILKFTKSRYVTITPTWPKLKLGGELSSVEVKGRYNVTWGGKVNVGFDPIFGLSGKFDALQWLIDVACYVYIPPPGGKIVADQIKYLRDIAEKGRGNEDVGVAATVRLDISAGGKFGGQMEWEFLPERKDKATGEFGGDLDLSVEGKVSAEARIWKVSYEAGASIKGATGISGKITACMYGDDPAWEGSAKFKGLTITGVAYQSVGGSNTGNEKSGQAPIEDRKKPWWKVWERDDKSVRAKDSKGWKMVIIKPAPLFSEDESADSKSPSSDKKTTMVDGI